MKSSTNGYLLTESYKNEGVKSEIKGGMSFTKHAGSLIKLELLCDYSDKNISLKKGSMIYFKEKDLGTLQWSKEIMTDSTIGVNYILARLENAILIDSKE